MDKEQLLQAVSDLAGRLADGKSVYTRSDLAYELKKLGVGGDSAAVGELVWEAYERYGRDARIRDAFVNNQRNRTLVEEQEIHALLTRGKDGEALGMAERQLDRGGRALDGLRAEVEQAVAALADKYGGTVMGVLKGTGGVEAVQKEAGALLARYTRMVDGYEEARCRIGELVATFVDLRGKVEQVYRRYAAALVDIYGDRIKVVAPEMFDFAAVRWLDVQQMLGQVRLEYAAVMSRSSDLLAEISEGFTSALETAAVAYRTLDSKQMGLVAAGVGLVKHYVGAGVKTHRLRADLLNLKTHVRHDAANINADLSRLLQVFKLLNDLYVPRATAFYRHAGRVLDDDLRALVDSVYQCDEARELRDEREQLIASMGRLERAVVDADINIAYYRTHIDECQELLRGMCDRYAEALREKPKFPPAWKRLLTLGGARRAYNRAVYEWTERCAPVVNRYETLKVDLDLDRKDLAAQERMRSADAARVADLQVRLGAIERHMLEVVKTDPEVRRRMLARLADMLGLLRVARRIVESGVDEDLRNPVKADDFARAELPEQVLKGIELLGEELAAEARAPEAPAAAAAETERTDARNAVVAAGAEFVKEWLRLQAARLRDAAAAHRHDEEAVRLRRAFSEGMRRIDDRSAVLRGVLAQINTAADRQQLREGLKQLAETDGERWTDAEWDDFIDGRRQIEL